MFERDRLEGSDIRQRMIDDEPWRDRVPDAVVETIEEIHGLQRLRTVAEDDVVERWEAKNGTGGESARRED